MTYPNHDRRKANKPPPSLRAIHEWEARLAQQKELIADLKLRGEPVKGEEEDLGRYEAVLNQLRNHQEIIQELMKPDIRSPQATRNVSPAKPIS